MLSTGGHELNTLQLCNMDMFQLRENIIEGLISAEMENGELTNEDGRNRAATENAEHTKKRKRKKRCHRIVKYEGPSRRTRKRCQESYKNIQK